MSHSVGIDRPSLLKVRRRYNELNDLMNNLQTKLSEVSASVDKDFLSSYRVHMMAIQAEIKELKQDIERGEQALNNDGTVAKLEAEVKWFVGKAHQTART